MRLQCFKPTVMLGVVFLVVLLSGGSQTQAGPALLGAAYSSGGPASLYAIDSSTGVATLIGAIGFARVSGIDFSPSDGKLYGVGEDPVGDAVLLTINTATGAGTAVGFLDIPVPQDISFRNADGTLFAYVAGEIYTIDTSIGAATLVGDTTDGFPSGNGLAFSPTDTLYKADGVRLDGGDLRTVEQTTGAATSVGPLTFLSPLDPDRARPNALDFDHTTGILYASIANGVGGTDSYLATIDITTREVTALGATVGGLDALAVAAPDAAVPEPGSLVLFASGALGLLWLANAAKTHGIRCTHRVTQCMTDWEGLRND